MHAIGCGNNNTIDCNSYMPWQTATSPLPVLTLKPGRQAHSTSPDVVLLKHSQLSSLLSQGPVTSFEASACMDDRNKLNVQL